MLKLIKICGLMRVESVAEAITTVRPYDVDVPSGIEPRFGKKDLALMIAFVKAAKEALSVRR